MAMRIQGLQAKGKAMMEKRAKLENFKNNGDGKTL